MLELECHCQSEVITSKMLQITPLPTSYDKTSEYKFILVFIVNFVLYLLELQFLFPLSSELRLNLQGTITEYYDVFTISC